MKLALIAATGLLLAKLIATRLDRSVGYQPLIGRLTAKLTAPGFGNGPTNCSTSRGSVTMVKGADEVMPTGD